MCGEQQYEILLYDDIVDVGANYLTIHTDSQPLYAKLGNTSDPLASHMRIFQEGLIYAVLFSTTAPTGVLSSTLRHLVVDEIFVDANELGSFVTTSENISSPYSHTTWSSLLTNIDLPNAFDSIAPPVTPTYTDEQWFAFNLSTQTIEGYDEINGGLDVNIPPQIGGIDVHKIGDSVFEWKGLTSIILPETLLEVGSYALTGNNITSLVIPASVNRLRGWACDGCAALTSVSILGNGVAINGLAFYGCPLTQIVIGANAVITRDVSTMGDNSISFEAFYYDTNNEQAGIYTHNGTSWSWVAL